MTFRTKLFVIFTLALLLSVGLVAVGVTAVTRRAFDQLNHQYSDAAVAQFKREFERREVEVVHQVQGIADAESTVRMAIDLSRPQPDVSIYVNDAHGVAQSHQLDFLDFVSSDGSIISSAEWSAQIRLQAGLGDAAGGLGVAWLLPDEGGHAERTGAGRDVGGHGARGRQEPLCGGRAAAGQKLSCFAGAADGHARAAVSESLARISAE